MEQANSRPVTKRNALDAFVLAALLCLTAGAFGVVGSPLASRGTAAFAGLFSCFTASTAILILRDHKWTMQFALGTVILLTVGKASDCLASHGLRASPATLVGFLAPIVLYWSMFFWYRKWTNEPLDD